MGLFFGRRETLNEQLVREAGLGPEREGRRPVREVLLFRPISAWWAKRRQRKLVRRAGERAYVNEREAARGRRELKLGAADRPPPGFG